MQTEYYLAQLQIWIEELDAELVRIRDEREPLQAQVWALDKQIRETELRRKRLVECQSTLEGKRS